ncbi:hypothetical protein, partial [Escherichia coli]|uniref:hypothetical protein n=1 Tax=Escherichia coli TaxID=562 RepID=UPI001411BC8E
DVELDNRAAELNNGEPDNASLLEWFKKLEFKSWIDELQSGGEEAVAASIAGDYEIVTGKKELQHWLDALQ